MGPGKQLLLCPNLNKAKAHGKLKQMYDVSPRKTYTSTNRLDEQIAATGHSIKDVKAVILGHLRSFLTFIRGLS